VAQRELAEVLVLGMVVVVAVMVVMHLQQILVLVVVAATAGILPLEEMAQAVL
jgi:hypothetical protein